MTSTHQQDLMTSLGPKLVDTRKRYDKRKHLCDTVGFELRTARFVVNEFGAFADVSRTKISRHTN